MDEGVCDPGVLMELLDDPDSAEGIDLDLAQDAESGDAVGEVRCLGELLLPPQLQEIYVVHACQETKHIYRYWISMNRGRWLYLRSSRSYCELDNSLSSLADRVRLLFLSHSVVYSFGLRFDAHHLFNRHGRQPTALGDMAGLWALGRHS